MHVLLQRVGIEEGHRVLDVGFRDAEGLKAIAACVGPTGHVAGIDANPQHVESVRDELARLSPGDVTADREGAGGDGARLQAGRHPLYR
jgi:tRNA A58 N-methylase Trm61